VDFEREVARHKDEVYRQMLRVCGNAEDAEDALAMAIIKAYRAADGLKDPGSFRPWLTTIGRRACIRLRQNAGNAMSLEALEAAGVPIPDKGMATAEEALELDRTRACALRAFESLPDQYRQVYQACEIDGLTAHEAAKRLGITEAAAKSRLHRARTSVRKALDSAFRE
jgi:RNA polymerase sigma-70 factor (ECF subfamily)